MYGIARSLWRVPRSVRSSPSSGLRAAWLAHARNRESPEFAPRTTGCWRSWSSGRAKQGDECHTSPTGKRANGSRNRRIRPLSDENVSIWNVANAVTMGRIVAAPLTGYWIVTGDYNIALGGLLFAGTSDWLDGFLARRLHLRTVIGSYLDPTADKLLISTTTVCLAYQDVIPPWLAVLIIGRDVALVVGWVALLRGKAGSFSPSKIYQNGVTTAIEPHFISKVNTTMQISLCFAGVISAGDLNLISGPMVEGIGIATALTTSASGLSYGLEYLRQRKQPSG